MKKQNGSTHERTKKRKGQKVARNEADANGLENIESAGNATETLLYQLLETEVGGVEIYETALRCVLNEDLREEWTKYLTETREHVEIARNLLETMGLDPDADNPGCESVHLLGRTLIQMMEDALEQGDDNATELTACECVVIAETKDHMNWKLLGKLAESMEGDSADVLRDAHEKVEKEEDHHLYHNQGWLRELWLQSLGLPSELPPPEEVRNVESAIGAARAEKSRRPSGHQHQQA